MIIEAREDTITLRGAITSNIWPAIQAAAALLLENHPTGIIIDCFALTKITAKGADTLADAFAYISSRDARIIVAGLSPEFLEIGKVAPAVRAQLPLADSVEEARASMRLEEVTPKTGKARVRAVVPIFGNWRRAVRLADKLAIGESCEVHLVDLIKVSRTLPIGTPLPERESEGQARVEAATAAVRQTRIKSFSHVERVRSESAGLAEFMDRVHADFTVVSIDRPGLSEPHIEEFEAMSLFEATGCEISLVKGSPREAPEMAVAEAIVPAVGAWEHALEHACRICSGGDARVTVVYVMTIPRSLPIDASMPDDEVAADDCKKEALRIGRRYGARVNPVVERVREPIQGFMRIVTADNYDLAVVGVMRETSGDYHIAHATAEALLNELPCEVVFLRVGEE